MEAELHVRVCGTRTAPEIEKKKSVIRCTYITNVDFKTRVYVQPTLYVKSKILWYLYHAYSTHSRVIPFICSFQNAILSITRAYVLFQVLAR